MDATLSHKREDLIWPYAQFVAQLLAREILGHKDYSNSAYWILDRSLFLSQSLSLLRAPEN